MISTTLKILTYDGSIEELNILCTFDFEDCNYLIAINSDNDYVCRKIKWSFWKGMYQNAASINNQALKVAFMLLKKAKCNPDFYVFHAEHYSITKGKNSNNYSIRKRGELRALKPYVKVIPLLSRLTVSIIFALIYGFICVNTSEITIAANVFGGLSRNRLQILIYSIQVLGVILLFLIRNFERNLADLCFNALIPYNVISLIAGCKVNTPVRIVVFTITALSSILWIFPKMIQAVKARKKTVKSRCWKKALHRCYAPFVACLCVAYIAIHFLGISLYEYSGAKINVKSVDYQLYYSAKIGLEGSKWNDYDTQERLDLLQIICDYECTCSLGCKSPKVLAGHLEQDTIYGEYNQTMNTITININHLKNDSAEKVLNTLLHEVRHAYQYALVKMFNKVEENLDMEDLMLPCFRNALSFRNDFDNYKNNDDDYYDYYDQEIERDSRNWALFMVKEIYWEYLYPDKEELNQ